MFCKNCGKEVFKDVVFCSFCGKKINEEKNGLKINFKSLTANKKIFKIAHIIVSTFMVLLILIGIISFSQAGQSSHIPGYAEIPAYLTLSSFMPSFVLFLIPFVYFFLVYRKLNRSSYIYKFSIFAIVIIFLNILLIGGQDLKYSNDVRDASRIITRMKELNRAMGLKAVMKDSMKQSEINTYNKNVDEFNSLIPKFNEIIERSGSRYYLIPIPIPMGAGKKI